VLRLNEHYPVVLSNYAQLDGTYKSKIFIPYTKDILDIFCLILQACQELLQAVEFGNVSTVKMLAKCTNVSCTIDGYARNTPLIDAADNGNVEVVQVLLESGANLEGANEIQRTALHKSASKGHLEVCRLLLASGAKVDPLDWWKETPLHYAARNGHLTVLKLLVGMGADVTMKNEEGQTAGDIARKAGHSDVSDWLDSVRPV
jgi:hypothetical protein